VTSPQYHLATARRIKRRAANLHAVRKQILHASATHPHLHGLHVQAKACASALYELAKALKRDERRQLHETLEHVEREAWSIENDLALIASNEARLTGLASQSHLAAKRLSSLRRELLAGEAA
jgi:hypothetical protein